MTSARREETDAVVNSVTRAGSKLLVRRTSEEMMAVEEGRVEPTPELMQLWGGR